MASGLTHTEPWWYPNRARWGKHIKELNFGTMEISKENEKMRVDVKFHRAGDGTLLEHKSIILDYLKHI